MNETIWEQVQGACQQIEEVAAWDFPYL